MNLPEEDDEEVRKLKEIKEHLEGAKENYQKAQNAIPYIQHEIEMTDWRIRLRENMPLEGQEIPKMASAEDLERERIYLQSLYRYLDIPSVDQMTSGTAVTTSSTSADYIFVSRVGSIGTPIALQYSEEYLEEYQKIQDVKNRPQVIRNLIIRKLDVNNFLERFDTALQSYLAYRSGSGGRTAAANDIRNLLQGLDGSLLSKATSHNKENMNWQIMARKLAINGVGGLEYKTLCEREKVHGQLKSQLAGVLKNMEGSGVLDLDAIWIGVLDHLFVILGLIE